MKAARARTQAVELSQKERCLMFFWRQVSEQDQARIRALLWQAYLHPASEAERETRPPERKTMEEMKVGNIGTDVFTSFSSPMETAGAK